MDTLAAYGSDDSSSSSSDAPPARPVTANVHQDTKTTTKNADTSAQNTARKRRWDERKDESDSSHSQEGDLPPPRLNQQQQSMVAWDIDYLKSYKSQCTANSNQESTEKEAASRAFLANQLLQNQDGNKAIDKKRSQLSDDKGWAAHLKQQHEFHNPRFLENVAHQCGIKSVLGSNLPEQETFEEFEYNLLELEETARMKAFAQADAGSEQLQQQQSQPSQFAQNQLERALQHYCHR